MRKMFFSLGLLIAFGVSYSQDYILESATYMGSENSESITVGIGINNKYEIFIAGNFAGDIAGTYSPSYSIFTYNGAEINDSAKIIKMNAFADTILQTTVLGRAIHDFDVQNSGSSRMVACGDWGVSVMDSSGQLLWTKQNGIDITYGNNSGHCNCDIADNGNVVLHKNSAAWNNDPKARLDEGQIYVWDAGGNEMHHFLTSTEQVQRDTSGIFSRCHVQDVTIKDTIIYLTGFLGDILNGSCGEARGLPIQSPFVTAYGIGVNSADKLWTTLGWDGSQLGMDQADAFGVAVNIGNDGKLYFLGTSINANSVFRWNGHECVCCDGDTDEPASTLVTTDLYNTPINMFPTFIPYFCRINPETGTIDKGSYIIPRMPGDNSTNGFRVKGSSIHADDSGNVVFGGKASYMLENRDDKTLNGSPAGLYGGGDLSVVKINSNFTKRTFWSTFSKDDSASGYVTGVATKGGMTVFSGNTNKGLLHTFGTRVSNQNTMVTDSSYAMTPLPPSTAGDIVGTPHIHDGYIGVFNPAGIISDQHLPLVSGRILLDINKSCNPGDARKTTGRNLIRITPPGNHYVSTNDTGYFSFRLQQGTYTLKALPPNKYFMDNCKDSAVIEIKALEDNKDSLELMLTPSTRCALMKVDLYSSRVRPCFSSNYYVSFKNNGVDTSFNTRLHLSFPPEIIPNSSVPAWTSVSDNNHTYDLGPVAPGVKGTVRISAYVSCAADLGATLCSEAWITADSLCHDAEPEWDRSSVIVTATCKNDSLARFVISNTGETGNGDMAGTSQYRIFSNNTMVNQANFQLNGGDSMVIERATGGHAIRLEADQRPGHPGKSRPRKTVERCGDITGTSLGQILAAPDDDEDIFKEVYCRVVTASFDPNDKQVTPSGIPSDNEVEANNQMEYTVRFQNTGTDTAFKVVIIDTLDINVLDINTFHSGISSHDYQVEVSGPGIVTWTFDSIMLPDSNVNEPASHGFIKFTINQLPDLSPGTYIGNKAAIYFDYNDPVITNTAWNTIYKLATDIDAATNNQQPFKILKVYPNPAKSLINLNLENISLTTIYNIHGEAVLYSAKKNIEVSSLPKGIYILKSTDKNGEVYVSKVVID